MNTTQPKTGRACSCKPGQARDNCAQCEGTGQVIDFAAIRAKSDTRQLAQLTGHLPANSSGRYRTKDGKALIEWELEAKEYGFEFSASGEYDGGAGQCVDSIAAAYPGDKAVQRIAAVWRVYHLNGMNAGTPEQTAFIASKEAVIEEMVKAADSYKYTRYDAVKELLHNAELYEVVISDSLKATGGFPSEVITMTEAARYRESAKIGGFMEQGLTSAQAAKVSDLELAHRLGKRGYHYGERWVFNSIPADVVAEIQSWSDFGPDDGKSLGDHLSAALLERSGITCRITLSDSKPAQWQPSGHHYRVTLSGKGRRLVFDFWGSIADAEEDKDPSLYSVLSCIASDINTPGTFEEFCSEFGDDSDSIKAKQTFTRCNRHAVKLRAFFTADEQEQLATIH